MDGDEKRLTFAEGEPESFAVVGSTPAGSTDPAGSMVTPANVPIRFPALDGCRAVAAVGVFITHLGLLTGYIMRHEWIGQYMARMEVGVSIFFVLSGFLLYRPMVAARFAGRDPRDVGTFARRRILRIFPAYWLALTIVAFVLRAPGFNEPHTVVAHYFLLHIYDSTQVIGGPIQQSWTLATEVAFYAFLPVWAWIMSRRRRRDEAQLKVEVVSLLALGFASALANVLLVKLEVAGSTFAQLGMWLPFRIVDFIPGMLLAILSAWVSHRSIRLPRWFVGFPTTIGCWLGSAAAFWLVSTQLNLPSFPVYTTRQAFAVRVLYVIVAVLFVAPAVIGRQKGGVVQALLGNRLAVWVGLISYGIYIWHEAWMDVYLRWFDQQPMATGVLGFGAFTISLTLVCAVISWYFVEKPVMTWGSRWR
ncbi:MAG: acyltransferase [Microthrixaceae bacterium]